MTPLEVRGEGVVARVDLAGDAPSRSVEPAPTLPDVSRLSGAHVVGLASSESSAARVILGCVRAPSSKWVPGLQTVVFERATPMILGAARMSPALDRASASEVPGAAFQEAFHGLDGERQVRVVHALAFVGEGADAVACSLVCSEPARPDAHACATVATSLTLSGDLRPEPPPGIVASAVLGAANRPGGALALAGAVSVAVVVLLLATRPKLRPTRRRST